MKKAIGLVLCYLFYTGVSCGADITDQVIGTWHFIEQGAIHGGAESGVLDIGRDEVSMPGGAKVDVVLSERDGRIAFRRAGTDEILMVAKVVDDNSIEIDFGSMQGKRSLRRISVKERERISAQESIVKNEKAIATALRNYANAQVIFAMGDQGSKPGNSSGQQKRQHCDNFRNLYYGLMDGNQLQLIPKTMADAFAGPTSGAPAVGDAPDIAIPYNGYLFLEDPVAAESDWLSYWGLIAYPVEYNQTGRNIFCIDPNGMVMEMDLQKRAGEMPVDGKMPTLISKEESFINNPGLWRPQ